jgi:hypothetical protein
MAERRPRDGVPGAGEHASVLEAGGTRQPVLRRYPDVGQRDPGLPDRAERALAVDAPRLVAGCPLLHQESLDLAVGDVPRPHDDDVGEHAQADPLLLPVDDPLVALAARRGLQGDGVRTVLGFGEREGAQLVSLAVYS